MLHNCININYSSTQQEHEQRKRGYKGGRRGRTAGLSADNKSEIKFRTRIQAEDTSRGYSIAADDTIR